MDTGFYYKKYKKYKNLYNYQLKQEAGANCGYVSYFFDNDSDNFIDKHLSSNVIPIKVLESPELSDINLHFCNTKCYNNYCKGLMPGAYHYGKMINILETNNGDGTGYDPISGISNAQIDHFINLVSSKQENIKCFIFDWDRTLTVFEGIYAIKPTVKGMLTTLAKQSNLSNSDIPDINVRDVAEYYLGGNCRIKKLQDLWDVLTAHNIEIWILSSNPSIGDYPKFFSQLLKSVNLDVELSKICYRDDLTKYEYIKKHIDNNMIRDMVCNFKKSLKKI